MKNLILKLVLVMLGVMVLGNSFAFAGYGTKNSIRNQDRHQLRDQQCQVVDGDCDCQFLKYRHGEGRSNGNYYHHGWIDNSSD